MIIAAHQPNYLPNLGFFHKMSQADLFVIVTNIQFTTGDKWQQRHRIRMHDADVWLTVPVLQQFGQCIKDVQITRNHQWRRKHRSTIEQAYAHTAEQELLHNVLAIYDHDWDRLVDLNVAIIHLLRETLDIRTPVVLDEEVTGNRAELVVRFCRKYGGDVHLAGAGSRLYVDAAYRRALLHAGIEHRVIACNLTPLFPYSTLHYLLTFGRESVRQIVRSGVAKNELPHLLQDHLLVPA